MNTNPPEPGGSKPGDNEPGAPEHQEPAEPVRWSFLLRVLGSIRLVIDRVLAAICIITFTGLVVIVTWQVFTREILGNSAPWTQEAALYTFVVLSAFAAAYVFSERGHIAVEILVEKLPRGLQRVMGVVIELVVIFFFVVAFIVGGSGVAENAWGQDISTLPLSVGQVFLVLPIAGVLVVFYSLTHIIGILAGVEEPTPDFDENAEAI